MSGLEVNKILAAIIMALLIVALIRHAGNLIVNIEQGNHHDNDNKLETAYKIDVPNPINNHSNALKKEKIINPISSLLINASNENGKKIFKKCGACHNYKMGSANKVGPTLWNIFNRPKASIEDFTYSKALSEIGGEWTFEELAEFIYKPKEYIKGTKMNFAGLKKIEDRADLILFLRNQSDNPIPIL